MRTRMIKSRLLLLAVLVCGTALAEDANTFYFTDAAVLPGETTNIELCMRNAEKSLTCLEAEIQLPEGLSVALDEKGNPIVTLYRNRTEGHEVLTNVLENGNLKLLVSDIEGRLFSGEEGPVLSFRVQAAEAAPIGESKLETVGESLLVNAEAKAYYSVGVTGNILVTDDATGIDGDLRGTDASDAIYTLAGERVSKARKGIFIQNGKKKLHK